MDVSVIIVNYNTFALTRACIASVLDKTKGVDAEIILVDNASTEKDPEEFSRIFPQIKLIKSPENLGFAKGNNEGLKYAQGEYILLLNSDTELINDAISISVKKMASDKRIGVLSAQLRYADERIQAVTGRFPRLSTELRELFRLNRNLTPDQRADIFLGDAFDHLSEKKVDWVWGAFFLTRREVINQFPENQLPDDFFMYAEDMQWCYWIKEKFGFDIVYYPEGKAYHYIGGSDTSSMNEWEKFAAKMLPNIHRFIKKEKGVLYSFLYFATKGIHYCTLRKKSAFKKAKTYFRLATK